MLSRNPNLGKSDNVSIKQQIKLVSFHFPFQPADNCDGKQHQRRVVELQKHIRQRSPNVVALNGHTSGPRAASKKPAHAPFDIVVFEEGRSEVWSFENVNTGSQTSDGQIRIFFIFYCVLILTCFLSYDDKS